MRPRPLCAAVAVALAAPLAGATAPHAAPPYAGTYTTTRPGADSTQRLTLVLDRNGRATLTTRFPDLEQRYGPGVLPVRETGSWRVRGSTAEVRFTGAALVRNGKPSQTRKENKVVGFALRRCRLIAVRYSKLLYGEAGLNFDKAGCSGSP